jgi:predicted RNase H-like nuclease
LAASLGIRGRCRLPRTRVHVVRFVGVDLAWTPSGGTGLCVIESGGVKGSARLGGDDELLSWLRPVVRDPVIVAIDAPLIVRNLTGRRPVEQMISRCFGAYHAGAHSANLGLPAFTGGVRGGRLALALDLDVDPLFAPREPVRRAIEVYPHTAIVALFSLSSILKYKAKPGRTLGSRSAALEALLDHLESLITADPPVEVRTSPRWPELRAVAAAPRTGAELARAEDEIDAYVCAYTALYYWTHGAARCRVVGDAQDGYIVTPVTAGLAACLDRQAASPGVAGRPAARRPERLATRLRGVASRVESLLPEAVVRESPHVVELSVSGEEGVVVLVTAEAIELRLPLTEWTMGTHGPAEGSRLWKRLAADASDALVEGELSSARRARAAEFATCRYCGKRFAAEHRVTHDVCHGCAAEHEGVVF